MNAIQKAANTALYNAKTPTKTSFDRIAELTLHLLYPSQIEYYLISFELQDSKNVVTDRLILPLLPTNVNDTNRIIATVQRTSGGVVSHYIDGFTPNIVTMSGNFMRDLKIVIFNQTEYQLTKKEKKENWESPKPILSNTLFTGYGAYNALRTIFNKSTKLDDYGKPFKVIYTNLIFSQSYYIQFMSLDGQMTTEQNFIHNYTLTFQKIGVANSLGKRIKDKTKEIVGRLKKKLIKQSTPYYNG